MREFIAFVLIACFPCLLFLSCDGGNGKKNEEFTVYDVVIHITNVEGIISDCPETADLKLSLKIDGNDISGFAELFGFGKIGDAQSVNGEVADGGFSIEPFGISVISDVPPDAVFPASSTSLSFVEFQGLFVDVDENGSMSGMEGAVSGEIFENTGDVVVCDGDFTGEFTGEAKSPEGCLSGAELGLEENRACPAEAISNLCDGVSYLCEIPESVPPGDFPINNSCVDIGCFTIDCPTVSEITDLQLGINGAISGNFQTPEGIGEPISCQGPN